MQILTEQEPETISNQLSGIFAKQRGWFCVTEKVCGRNAGREEGFTHQHNPCLYSTLTMLMRCKDARCSLAAQPLVPLLLRALRAA